MIVVLRNKAESFEKEITVNSAQELYDQVTLAVTRYHKQTYAAHVKANEFVIGEIKSVEGQYQNLSNEKRALTRSKFVDNAIRKNHTFIEKQLELEIKLNDNLYVVSPSGSIPTKFTKDLAISLWPKLVSTESTASYFENLHK